MHTLATNLNALWQVTLAGLLLGAGLPLIFSVGVRFWSMEYATDANGAPTGPRNTGATAIAYLCFAIVAISVAAGILFIAKAFLASRLGIHVFGA